MKKIMRWMVILAAMTAVWTATGRWDAVQALRDGSHTVEVITRADRELTPKSAAGRYYHNLYWKYGSELGDILLREHPEHRLQFVMVIDSFVPAIEALLDGNGDSVTISAEQIEHLQTELDWLKSVSSDALRADIEREETLFPLKQFVGMTIVEAYETVTTQWRSPSNE